MKKNHTPTVFKFNDHEIRAIRDEIEDVWFVAKDVAAALGFTWSGNTLDGINEAWKGVLSYMTQDGEVLFKSVNLSAVHRMAFLSDFPYEETDAFLNWITATVIPFFKIKAAAKTQNSTQTSPGTSPGFLNLNYNDHQIRTITHEDGSLWWVAKDVCDVLGLSDVSMSLQSLEEDEKLIQTLLVSGQNRQIWTINEPGLYTLIIRSNKPEAKKFKRWINHEVLPSIRKTGAYAIPKAQEAPQIEKKSNPMVKLHVVINVGKKAAPEFYDPDHAWEQFKDHVHYFGTDKENPDKEEGHLKASFLFDFFNIVGDKNDWYDALIKKYKLKITNPDGRGYNWVDLRAADFIYRVEYARMQDEKEKIARGELEGPIVIDMEIPDGESYEFFANRHLKTRAAKLLKDLYHTRTRSMDLSDSIRINAPQGPVPAPGLVRQKMSHFN